MRSTRKKVSTKPVEKSVFKTKPVLFVLAVLLCMFLIDLYRVITADPKAHHHHHHAKRVEQKTQDGINKL